MRECARAGVVRSASPCPRRGRGVTPGAGRGGGGSILSCQPCLPLIGAGACQSLSSCVVMTECMNYLFDWMRLLLAVCLGQPGSCQRPLVTSPSCSARTAGKVRRRPGLAVNARVVWWDGTWPAITGANAARRAAHGALTALRSAGLSGLRREGPGLLSWQWVSLTLTTC